MAAVKNLIFDLGNVLYDIDFKKMNSAFASIGIEGIEKHFTLNKSHPLFLDLEMGFVNENEFVHCLRVNSPRLLPQHKMPAHLQSPFLNLKIMDAIYLK